MIRPKYEAKKRRRDTTKTESKRAYDAVAYRSKIGFDISTCEYCAEAEAIHMHHRQFRSRGGLDEVVNIVHLCDKCHRYAHSGMDATLEGLAVSQFGDPAKVPVSYRGTVVMLLPTKPWLQDLAVPF